MNTPCTMLMIFFCFAVLACGATTGQTVTVSEPANKCRSNPVCTELGYCSLKNDQCVAGSDADCKQSGSCHSNGNCKAWGGKCVWGGAVDADCNKPRGSLGFNPCKKKALCIRKAGVCVLGSDVHCRQSHLCRHYARCYAVDGYCQVKSDADCKASSRCKEAATCSIPAGGKANKGFFDCIVGSHANCKQGVPCKDLGFCTFKAATQSCIAEGDDCKKSYVCLAQGKCTAHKEWCVATTDSDCQASSGCKKFGHCKARNEQCVR